MKKVAILTEILDPKLIDRLIYLDKLLKVYCRFLINWRYAEITTNGSEFNIRFSKRSPEGNLTFTEATYPIDQLQKQIESFKRKLTEEFKIRHSNARIMNERLLNQTKN